MWNNFKRAQQSAMRFEAFHFSKISSSVGKFSNRMLDLFSAEGRKYSKVTFLSWETASFQISRHITRKRHKNRHCSLTHHILWNFLVIKWNYQTGYSIRLAWRDEYTGRCLIWELRNTVFFLFNEIYVQNGVRMDIAVWSIRFFEVF